MRSIIDITDLSVEEISELMDTAMDIIANPAKYAHACDGKILATLFFEPSTRTRLSFEAAMQSLGGSVISLPSADKASSSKLLCGHDRHAASAGRKRAGCSP